MPNLEYTVAALIDQAGEIVWCCLPRFDADPTFCSLLHTDDRSEARGTFVIELVDQVAS